MRQQLELGQESRRCREAGRSAGAVRNPNYSQMHPCRRRWRQQKQMTSKKMPKLRRVRVGELSNRASKYRHLPGRHRELEMCKVRR